MAADLDDSTGREKDLPNNGLSFMLMMIMMTWHGGMDMADESFPSMMMTMMMTMMTRL